jgi:hypothetical protein
VDHEELPASSEGFWSEEFVTPHRRFNRSRTQGHGYKSPRKHNNGYIKTAASAVKNTFARAEITDRIKTISCGKEEPFCTESNQTCWQQNRRGHFVYAK